MQVFHVLVNVLLYVALPLCYGLYSIHIFCQLLAASGMPSHSTLQNGSTVEASLTMKIPNGQSARVSSECVQPLSSVHGRTNITVPVSVQKQPLPEVTSAEGLDTDGLASGNLPPRRRRKPWTAAEDLELIAAVKKFGEGNWANILKGEFKSERTASQLSQVFSLILSLLNF